MPSYIFPDEVHNEDAHYSRLAIGFLQSSDEHQIPLRFTDPELEAILFPISRWAWILLTYGKYIKMRSIIRIRFSLQTSSRVDDVVIHAIRKLRNFQNNARIFRQRHVDSTHTRPSAIRQSHYTHDIISKFGINEGAKPPKKIPLPS
jgi:hypothetical protein